MRRGRRRHISANHQQVDTKNLHKNHRQVPSNDNRRIRVVRVVDRVHPRQIEHFHFYETRKYKEKTQQNGDFHHDQFSRRNRFADMTTNYFFPHWYKFQVTQVPKK